MSTCSSRRSISIPLKDGLFGIISTICSVLEFAGGANNLIGRALLLILADVLALASLGLVYMDFNFNPVKSAGASSSALRSALQDN